MGMRERESGMRDQLCGRRRVCTLCVTTTRSTCITVFHGRDTRVVGLIPEPTSRSKTPKQDPQSKASAPKREKDVLLPVIMCRASAISAGIGTRLSSRCSGSSCVVLPGINLTPGMEAGESPFNTLIPSYRGKYLHHDHECLIEERCACSCNPCVNHVTRISRQTHAFTLRRERDKKSLDPLYLTPCS